MNKRIPIENGKHITIDDIEIEIVKCIGEGSSCLVYEGKICKNGQILSGAMVTVKEFYPRSRKSIFDIERDAETAKLRVSIFTGESTEYQDLRQQFEVSYRMQDKLANSSAMEIAVKPYLYGTYGDTVYIVSNIHLGKSLDKVHFETLEEKLACAVRVTEIFGILHKNAYMLLDFKPENIFWTEHPKGAKLIDTDSVIELNSSAHLSEEEPIYMNDRYSGPEILTLKEIVQRGEKLSKVKKIYLKPTANVYSLGVYLFEILFGRWPSEEDKKFERKLTAELFCLYKEELGKEEVAVKLLNVLQKAMQYYSFLRYENADIMMDELNQVLSRITAERYLPKKAVSSANYTYLSYDLLEKYPLYAYSKKADKKTILDVAIVGSHAIREHLIKTIVSCGQMLDSELNIRLISEDAEQFWDHYKSVQCNPELQRTVRWAINGTFADNEAELRLAEIVKEPLATVYVYTDNSDDSIKNVIKENQITYIVFAEEDEKSNYERVEKLLQKLQNKKHFIGYLAGEKSKKIPGKDRIKLEPIKLDKVSERYDEKAFESAIYNMGMCIHEYYYRGNHPRATSEEIENTYKKDFYNIESSERSALHTNYKLKSVGIEPTSPKAPFLFYEKILSQKEGEARKLFDELVALEHRSWTAFAVLSGIQAVDDADQDFKAYAYEGESDWRKRGASKNIIAHPCLKASRPGRGLINKSLWNKGMNNLGKQGKELDPLDRRSLEIHYTVEKIAKEREEGIYRRLKLLEINLLEDRTEIMQNAYKALLFSVDKVFGKETSAIRLWEQAIQELRENCKEEGILKGKLEDDLSLLEKQMQPALRAARYHDFKQSDEDIIRAIPKLIFQNQHTQKQNTQITIIKPVAKNAWQNLFSSIIINPDRLVLVPMDGESKEQFKEYSSWLKHFCIDAEVMVRDLNQLRQYGGPDGIIFIDETGTETYQARKILSNAYMRSAHTFQVKDRHLMSTDSDPFIVMFDRSVNLTVEETLLLHGAEMYSEKEKNYILGLSLAEYKSIWNLYRDLMDARKWKAFIQELSGIENKRIHKILPGDKTGSTKYESIYIENTVLKNSGLTQILGKLKDKKFLESYSIPELNRYGKVSFSTEYQRLAEKMKEIIYKAATEPIAHHYTVTIEEPYVILKDDSLYVNERIPHTEASGITGVTLYRDDVVKEVYDIINKKNPDKVFQNFQFEEGKLSFRYASSAVKEVLQKEGSILEAMIFLECRRMGIFDDVRCNVKFWWPGYMAQNEIDVIGTKNSKTYFISAKMQAPKKEFLYEIDSLGTRFSVEGETILVSSHYTTGKQEEKGTDFSSHSYAVEQRVQGMPGMSYIGKDSVDFVENGVRKIVVASSIAKIVRAE